LGKQSHFGSVADLQSAINRFVAEHNETEARPFIWRADPDAIIASRNRGFQALGQRLIADCRSKARELSLFPPPPRSIYGEYFIFVVRFLRRCTPRKGTIMTIANAASAVSRLNDESVRRSNLDHTAEERSENEGMAEHAQKALDPIAWEEGRNRGSSGGDDIVSKYPEERKGSGEQPLVETTDLERRVLVLERILQELIAHMAETEPRFIDRLSVTFTDPIRVAHEEQNYIDTASYAERFIREIVRLGEQPGGWKIRTPRYLPNPKRAERRVTAPPGIPDRLPVMVELRHRSGIWEVTKDGHFYGDYLSEQGALDSAQAAVTLVVAGGGFATLSGAVN
jgi:hypothetical protein